MPVIVLDTNVISELMRPQPDQRVLAWANSLDPESAAITAMNEAEILHGLARLPDGRRKQALYESWDALAADLFAGRVWAFTSEAAHWYDALVSHRERLARAAEPNPVQPDARFVACPASRRGRKVQCSSCGRQGQGEHRAVTLTPWLRGVEGSVSSPMRHGSHHHRSLPVPPVTPEHAPAVSSRAGRPSARVVLTANSAAKRELLGRVEPLPLPSPPGSPPPPPTAPES